jgi:purine-binding chemotaxis protein CheW
VQTSTTQDMSAGLPATDYRAGKYLAFHVGPEEFAISVLGVREIMGIQDITAVPHAPPYVKGIINLRGRVVPIVDLRLKFQMPSTEYTARTCIVVVNVGVERGGVLMGVIVDAVSEVVNLAANEIENAPDFGGGVDVPYLIGIARCKGSVKLLLDIEKVLTSSESIEPGQLLN